jgi:sec-independent protein translocase protein TatC
MPILEHLREMRNRLVKGVLAIVLGTVVAWFFYDEILTFLTGPYEKIRPDLAEKGIESTAVLTGIGGAFQFQLKISLVAGILGASPIWLYQIWAFVLPAMRRNEKRWALLLTATGAPLFLAGAALAYLVLPKAFVVLIGFVPEGFENLVSGAEYFDFVVRMLLVFGVAAEIPLVVILLNRLGVVSAQQLAGARSWTILGIFVFSAIATPSTDPLTMLFLAVPMTVLYGIAEIIARLTDRRRAKQAPVEVPDDEISRIDD